jgi:leucyl aminopeptidase (aminopeptidase T)
MQCWLCQNILEEMIKVENADKIGEFSLTDKRISKINKFMAETLYDENFGGNMVIFILLSAWHTRNHIQVN